MNVVTNSLSSRPIRLICMISSLSAITSNQQTAAFVFSPRKYASVNHHHRRQHGNNGLHSPSSTIGLFRHGRQFVTRQTKDETTTIGRDLRSSITAISSLESDSDSELTLTASVSSTDESTIESKITEEDCGYMALALDHARKGRGNTYPNPAVGCVIVAPSNDDTDDQNVVIGAGFHPRSGFPHAEVFALLEAYGHLDSGVGAALSIVEETRTENATGRKSGQGDNNDRTEMMNRVKDCLEIYSLPDGAERLFSDGDLLRSRTVTAYVTLEPCCHYGKTPPCAVALVRAGVRRVVVGLRDPNPRVDGGGVALLESEGVIVDTMLSVGGTDGEGMVAEQCAEIVRSFVRRISPRRTVEDGMGLIDYEESMNGAKRAVLRSLAGKWKNEGTMAVFAWQAGWDSVEVNDTSSNLEEAIAALPLNHRWMEKIDDALWEKELILVRLNAAVAKKKGAKILGKRLAEEVGAHVAQVVGHTVLLYRPGFPPVLDLNKMVEDRN